MFQACFTGEKLDPLIVCEQGGIGTDEYENILYDGLFSLIDDLLQPLEDSETIGIANDNACLFI